MNAMSTFTDTVNRMWETRPPRIRKDQGGRSYVAGVCEGIGVRYQIDPTLVRIAFVVTALAVGGGIAAYLLAWMCMPRYGMTTSPAQAVFRRKDQLTEQERGERPAGWWLLIGFILLSGLFTVWDSDYLGSTAIIAIALLLLAWYGLHQRLPEPPAGLLPGEDSGQSVNLSAYTSMNPQPAPPAWDPLGTAPFAWHLPEPSAPEPARKKTNVWAWVLGGFGITVLVVALVGAAGGFLWLLAGDTGRETITPTSAEELSASYQTGEQPLTLDLSHLPTLTEGREVTATATDQDLRLVLPENIPVTVSCDDAPDWECAPGNRNPGAEGETLKVTLIDGPGDGAASITTPLIDPDARPTTENQLQDTYDSEAGPATFDFSRLPTLEKEHTVEIDHGVGPLTVLLPRGPVELVCEDGLGATNCTEGTYHEDAEGELLTIRIDGGVGPVHVSGLS